MDDLTLVMHRRGGSPAGYARQIKIDQSQRHPALAIRELFSRGPVSLALCGGVADDVVLTGDLRLDNQDELKRLLQVDGRLSDADLVAHAYRRWGRQFVRYLEGDFALALWDAKTQRVVLARDFIGVKPLYFFLDETLLAVASNANALAGAIPCTVNEARIVDYRVDYLESVDARCTFFNEVTRLPAATVMEIDARAVTENAVTEDAVIEDTVTVETYWNPQEITRVNLSSDLAYEETFRELFVRAVTLRHEENVSGIMLSGGIDSAAVTGAACSTGATVHSFSGVIDPAEGCPDSMQVRKLSDLNGLVQHNFTPAMLCEGSAELEGVLISPEEPFDVNMLQSACLYEAASQRGFTVVLDGLDGETPHCLPSNYPGWLADRYGFWSGLRETRLMWERWYEREENLAAMILSYLRGRYTPAWLRRFKRGVVGPPARREVRALCKQYGLSSSLTDRICLEERIASSHAWYEPAAGDFLQRCAYMRNPAVTVALERYDRIARRFGIEARHPLLDRKLVEFTLAVPFEQLGRHGYSKYLLRRSVTPFLPEETCWQTSAGDNGHEFVFAWVRAHREMIAVQLEGNQDLLARYGFNVHEATDDLEEFWYATCLANWYRGMPDSITPLE